MTFKEYIHFCEEFNLGDVRVMLLRALGANPDDKAAHNAPLVQFADPEELKNKILKFPGLQDIISRSPSALKALQNAQQTNLTVGQLAGIIAQQEPEREPI